MIGATAAAVVSNCRSVKRGAVSVTPTGIPFGPARPGRLTQGTCSSVHIRLNTASPGWPPGGASPGALGASTASCSAAKRSNAARHAAAWS